MTKRVTTVGDALLARLAAQAEVLAALEPAVRADEPDAVHRMRVACRRLRSALRTYRRLLAAGPARDLATEAKWLGAALGQARDHEVLRERLLAAARELPAECEPQRTAERLTAWSEREYRRAWPEVVDALDSPRHRAFTEALDRLLADPPLRGRARRPAGPELARIAAREQRRTAVRVRRALATGAGPERDLALHEARKAAKRARYAGETAKPVAGRPAERYTERMKAVQDALGEHQDAVVAAGALHTLAENGGPDAFVFGVLYGGQLAAAARAREELPGAWARAAKRKLSRLA
ncbi:CHAD domain-containing protein [Kitasatospora sp. NPDC050543]|uniref:CHAD domain-containing protein n=1 Tax=Kitasatospora sp. NPDC050543 TaxID=3364054 RepID=UPI00379A78A5